MRAGVRYSAIVIFTINIVVWIYGLSKYRFLADEIWLYLGIFLVPGFVICFSILLMSRPPTWRKALGFVIFISGMAVWLFSLLLVSSGFKIH